MENNGHKQEVYWIYEFVYIPEDKTTWHDEEILKEISIRKDRLFIPYVLHITLW